MIDRKKRRQYVVIGGGTGTYSVLSGLKRYADEIDITAVIGMSDSGGSTGRLRDEFGYLPVGDVRMALAALSRDYDEHEELVRELFLYRFNKGVGLEGHNFGNLLLVALTDLLGSEAEAVRVASRILRVRGKVLPVTEDHMQLVATYDDGETRVGEHTIDEPSACRAERSIVELAIEQEAAITPDVATAILKADVIVLGPGDLYTSLLPNFLVKGMPEAIQESAGKFVYISNLMSRPGQTRSLKLSQYLSEIERYLGRRPDLVFSNTTPLPADILAKYEAEGDYPVEDDLDEASQTIRGDFLTEDVVEKKSGDILKRSLIRHDGKKLARHLVDLF